MAHSRLVFLCAVAACLACGCSRPDARAERRLRIALGSVPLSLDPHYAAEAAAYIIHSNVFETLVETDAQLAVRPSLALRWTNPDDVTWVFDLVPGVRFHDGATLTSADVAFSLLRARDDPRSDWRSGLRAIERVDMPSADRVVIRTARPQPMLLRWLAGIAIVPKPSTIRDGLERRPIGSGPFRFVSADPALTRVELARFDGYHGPRPVVDRVVFMALPEAEARGRAARSGEVDMVVDVPPDFVDELRRTAGWAILETQGLREMFLVFDVKRPQTPYASPPRNPFLDRRVRAAFFQAIDTRRIVRETLRGFATEASQFAAPSVFGYEPEIKRLPYDPEAARRLIRDAGFGGGFSVTLHATDGVYLGDAAIADFIARSLADLKVSVRVERVEKSELFRRVRERDASLYLLTWSCLSGDVQEVLDNVLRTPDADRGLGLDNGGQYGNPLVDSLAEEAGRALAPRTRQTLLRRAVATAMADLPWVPIYVQTHVYGLREPYRWTARPDKKVRAADMELSR